MRLTFLSVSTVIALSHFHLASAQNVMYDFESPLQFEDWTVVNPRIQRVEPSDRFATSGSTSAHLVAEASDLAPRFDLRLWDNNFEPYNRLAFDLTNASTKEVRFVVALVGDIDNGYRFSVSVPPLTHKTVVHKIELPKFIRHDNIHFLSFTAETGMPVDVYVDTITPLRKDDPEPDKEAQPVADQVQELRRGEALRLISGVRASIYGQSLRLPEATELMLRQLDELEAKATAGSLSQENAVLLVDDVYKVGQTADRFEEIRAYVDAYGKDTSAGFVVGFADSMRKIMPKHLRTNLDIVEGASLSLAGGEKESFQVAVVPFRADAKQVSVRVSELKGPGGAILTRNDVDVDLMGYAKTVMKTEPTIEYMGWWPEPIIATDKPVDVALGDVQTWWVRVRAPRDQTPGLYTGSLTVSAEGQEDLTFDVSVNVYGFNVPKHAPIPTAITYVSRDFTKIKPIGSREKWDEIKFAHTDVLNDYYINIDSIYNRADPSRLDAVDWDLIEHQRRKGTLVSFNITHFNKLDEKGIAEIRPYYEEAKKRGLLQHAYIYGFDETPPSSWPSIEEATKLLAEEFPEVLTMVTSQDHSYGLYSPIQHLGAWCPIISRYNPVQAEKARELGRKVWWYTCIWPPRPYPNIFVDYPAIDNRVLTGLMHMKYQPDGFLYYHTSIWRGDGLSTFPYTDWNPNSYQNTNGDGAYFVLGADATLIPTIRIENYRDGFEDLAYYMILEHQVAEYERRQLGANDAWLREAKGALGDIERLVRTRTDWTTNPQDIYAYRDRLATLIESSPIEDNDPWAGGMGVRGLPRE